MKLTRAISLEQYLDFLHSGGQGRLTIGCLNQIVSMHGFRKITQGKAVKKVLVDAVKTIDLIDPSRSTVQQYVSPHAFLELDEVITDLNALCWHECCTTSIKTICKETPPTICKENPLASEDGSKIPLKALKWKGSKKRKGAQKSKGKGGDGLSTFGLMEAGKGQEKAQKKRMKLLKEIAAGTS